MARNFAIFWCFGLAVSLSGQTTAPRPGTIRGAVITSDGAPAAIQVHAARTSPLPAVVANAIADPAGNFQITGLHPGVYELCFTATNASYVDPCLWEESGEILTVSAGATVQATFTLQKAATLKVHVVDAGKLVRESQDGAIVMGVFGPGGRLHRLGGRDPDASGKNYVLAVPYDRDLTFTLKPVGLDVADDSNKPVPDWKKITMRENSNGRGPKLRPLTFVVKGKKQ